MLYSVAKMAIQTKSMMRGRTNRAGPFLLRKWAWSVSNRVRRAFDCPLVLGSVSQCGCLMG
jgi:hypothetical protein